VLTCLNIPLTVSLPLTQGRMYAYTYVLLWVTAKSRVTGERVEKPSNDYQFQCKYSVTRRVNV